MTAGNGNFKTAERFRPHRGAAFARMAARGCAFAMIAALTSPVLAAEDCLAALRGEGWEAEPAVIGAGTRCAVETPVRMARLRWGDTPARAVEFPDKPVLACGFAANFGHFVRDLVAPLAAGGLGAPLKAVQTGPGFDCRNVNHNPAGKLSAHASGIAIDVAGFQLANGRRLTVGQTGGEADLRFFSALRAGACGWFTTVLGPGSDPAHAAHLHFDTMRHGSSANYRICQ